MFSIFAVTMNTMQFVALFFNLAVLLSFSSALGTFETVTLNGALTVPLLSAAAGSLATPLAVLGVIKLGAAALLALALLGPKEEESYGYEEQSSGYGRYRRRHTRALVEPAREVGAPAELGANDGRQRIEFGSPLHQRLWLRGAAQEAEGRTSVELDVRLFETRQGDTPLNVFK